MDQWVHHICPAKIEQAGKNVQVCLEAAAAKASDIVLTRANVTGRVQKERRHISPLSRPGQHSDPVPSLSAGADFLVEIEAVAVID